MQICLKSNLGLQKTTSGIIKKKTLRDQQQWIICCVLKWDLLIAEREVAFLMVLNQIAQLHALERSPLGTRRTGPIVGNRSSTPLWLSVIARNGPKRPLYSPLATSTWLTHVAIEKIFRPRPAWWQLHANDTSSPPSFCPYHTSHPRHKAGQLSRRTFHHNFKPIKTAQPIATVLGLTTIAIS